MRFVGWLFAMGVHGALMGLFLLWAIFWWFSHDLPDTQQLAGYEPPTLSRVHAGDGALLAEFARQHRLYTPIDEIPELVRHAFISAEDKNFYEHSGVDGFGFAKAMVDNVMRFLAGRRLRGGSTITQQVVKNFLLDGSREIERKIREIILARRLEEALSKDEILEIYLNEIFLGQRAYGVTSAALRYFGARLEDLTPAQVAYLASLPQRPSELHPIRQYEEAIGRRNFVLREMFENGYLTEDEYETARAEPLDTILDDPDPETARMAPPPLDYFAEEIRRELIAEDRYGEEGVYGGGLSIRATVDPELQTIAREVLQQRLWEYSRERGYIGPAARIEDLQPLDETAWRAALDDLDLPRDVQPWRLAVVLLVGERSAQIGIRGVESDEPIYLPFSDVREWAAPREGLDARDQMIVGALPTTPSDVWSVGDVVYVTPVLGADGETVESWSMRQIPEVNGGLVALDPHTGRVLAMQGGFSFQASSFNRVTQADRQPGSAFKPFVFAAALEAGYQPNTIVLDGPVSIETETGEIWRPQNSARRFFGPRPLRFGLERSLNVMTVRLALDFGLEPIAAYAERFGVYDDMPELISYTLGSGETTLLRMTASYAMFVNGGRLIEPTFIDRIQNRHGETVFRHDDRICSECRATDWAGQAEPYVPTEGEQVMDPVTAYQVVSMLEGVTVRGTASGVGRALDFPVAGKTGTTNDLRDGWFIGFSSDLLVGCYIGFDQPRTLGDRQFGGTLCGPVFERFMDAAVDAETARPFRRPSGVELVAIDVETGCALPAAAAGEGAIWEAFRADAAPEIGVCPPGGIGLDGERSAGSLEMGDEADGAAGRLVIGGVQQGFGFGASASDGGDPAQPAFGAGLGSGAPRADLGASGGASGVGDDDPASDLTRAVSEALGLETDEGDDADRAGPPTILTQGDGSAGAETDGDGVDGARPRPVLGAGAPSSGPGLGSGGVY